MSPLRKDERDEDHEANELPEGLGRLGEAEEIDNDAVPEELAEEAEDDNRKNEGEERGGEVDVGVALHLGGTTDETLDGGTAG